MENRGSHVVTDETGADFSYRGDRLGLPREGPGSIAPPGRRVAAIFVDWTLCGLIAYGLLADGQVRAANSWTLVVFLVMSVLTVGTLGRTPGKRLLGLRVVHVGGGRLTFPRAALRSVLLSLAIPALIWDRDTRGLHDKLTDAVQVRA